MKQMLNNVIKAFKTDNMLPLILLFVGMLLFIIIGLVRYIFMF